MPSFSGLWDGVHGEAYASMTKADAQPPFQRGIVRALMQGRGMHGHVTALGRNAPSSIAQINAQRDGMSVKGTFNWPERTTDKDVTITNAQSHTASGRINVSESIARPSDATEADMAHTYDTTLRNGHPADAAMTGVTSPAVSEVISDGT